MVNISRPKLATLALVAATALGAALTVPAGASKPATTAGSPRATTTVTRATLRALRPKFDLLRRSPSGVAHAATLPAYAANIAATLSPNARLGYSSPQGQVYAYTNGDDFCVQYIFGGIQPGAATACAHASVAAQLGASVILSQGTTQSPSAATVIAAVLPDAVSSIAVTKTDGTHITVPVSNNVAFYAGTAVRDWTFTDASGNAHTDRALAP
jgi:hypothetical protein